jgi:ankyrin repeat protein
MKSICSADEGTLLRESVQKGRLRLVDIMLLQGVDIDAADKEGLTALHFVADPLCTLQEAQRLKLLHILLSSGADVNAGGGWTPLHEAACNEITEVAEILLNHGAYVNSSDESGPKPLYLAVVYGTPDVVRLLLAAGADVRAVYKPKGKPSCKSGGDTPLHAAANRGIKDMGAMLLKAGADVNAQNFLGQTPLHKLLDCFLRGRSEMDLDLMNLFIEWAADLELPDNSGTTARELMEELGLEITYYK